MNAPAGPPAGTRLPAPVLSAAAELVSSRAPSHARPLPFLPRPCPAHRDPAPGAPGARPRPSPRISTPLGSPGVSRGRGWPILAPPRLHPRPRRATLLPAPRSVLCLVPAPGPPSFALSVSQVSACVSVPCISFRTSFPSSSEHNGWGYVQHSLHTWASPLPDIETHPPGSEKGGLREATLFCCVISGQLLSLAASRSSPRSRNVSEAS